MSIEAGIGEKTEKAISNKNDKADLSSVFDDWKNNTSKAENQAERTSINNALHKVLPKLSIIDFTTDETGARYVTTFDGESNKLQLRTVNDFKVVEGQESDLTKAMAEKKETPEQVVQYLSTQVDAKKDADSKKSVEQSKTDEAKVGEVKQYAIQPGDNLWKIAKREIVEANKANGKSDAVPSPNEVKAFIDKIVLANREGDGAIKNANVIYAGKTLNIPVEKKEVPKTEEEPKAENKEVPKTEEEPKAEKKEAPKTDEEPKVENKEVPKTQEEPKVEKQEEIEVKPSSANTEPSNKTTNATTNVPADSFTPKADTYYNPTIGADEAAKESAVLNKFYEQMRTLDGAESGKAFVTAAEINKFIEANKTHLPRTDGQPVPNAEEIELLEKAAKNIVRIAASSNDELFFESSGATRKDVQIFAEQEKDFEGRFQARFYLDKHFDRMTAGQDHISVAEIKVYRDQLATRPNSEAEVKAVDNVLVQLGKHGYKDGSILFRDNAKAAIRDEVGGSSYAEYGGRSYPIPVVAAK